MNLAVIADELTAVGWRLSGARVWVPEAENVQECLLAAAGSAQIVLITAELAARIPHESLQRILLAQPPLVQVIADVRRRQEPPDIENETRRALGVAV